MANCGTCTKLSPIKKNSSDANCKKTKQKIEEVRIFCPDDITETLSISHTDGCPSGYVSDFVDPNAPSTPLVSVDVLNPDDLDENNEFSYDDQEDEGDDQYNLTPIRVKAYTPEQQCMLDTMKGQIVGIVYKIANKSGEYVWRRMYGRLNGITGGLIQGYDLTFNSNNPEDEEKPMWLMMTDADTTETALDAMTNFG